MTGPTLPFSQEINKTKHRLPGEGFKESVVRQAEALKDNYEHFLKLKEIYGDQRFLNAGRIQASIGSPRETTPYNCFVSSTIPDSMDGIMEKLWEAAKTMQLGGGIGYDFSTLRPRGALIKSLDSKSSGPISFMEIFNALCGTISSAGHRRGAQMGVLRIDHPDIEEFIRVKQNKHSLTNFNISVGVTDGFMDCVKHDRSFDLVFEGRTYKTVNAKALWDELMRSTWDWAEPGVLFIDKINRKNNLHYCETIVATNPCAEQPLPPYGACLLGSFNLVKYIDVNFDLDYDTYRRGGYRTFNYDKFANDIPHIVRALDNVVDRAIYPLDKQKQEAQSKRRMGIGVTGVANAIEALGYPYGSPEFLAELQKILVTLRDTAYRSSISLAIEKGPFPKFSKLMLNSEFCKGLPEDIRQLISEHGIRNSHLLSIAPTGTISLGADNVSSGIEPVFAHSFERTVRTFDGMIKEVVTDYGYRVHHTKGKTAYEVPAFDHVEVLNLASRYVDSACSKTCNVGSDVTWEDFKKIYEKAYDGGASGCTTFRKDGKRYGILNEETPTEVIPEVVPDVEDEQQLDLFGAACYYDPATGSKTCD
jgi:ribonucleoside-diphosphate reductase alpha chain